MSVNRRNPTLFRGFTESPASFKIALMAVVAVWTAVLAVLIGGFIFAGCALETPGQALQPTPGTGIPGIVLDPTKGPPGTPVIIRGEGWNPDSTVLVYLIAPGQTEPPNYATAGSVVDAMGQFTLRFVVPSEPDWENEGLATVIVRTTEGGSSAQAFFTVVAAPETSAPTPTASPEPTPTPTETPALPTPTPQPGEPTATAVTDLNIRGGPSTAYPILGMLRAGQSVEITGVSPDRGWWQIRFSGAADERGWISASYTRAENTQNVPVVEPPPLPPTPTPTPTPVPPTPTPTPLVIQDWRGEYYDNPTLNGNPALVRNDVAINFDWRGGSPAAGLPADNFSARWTRNLSFQAGTYRFYAYVDDGARLWVDGMLVIDQWHDSPPTIYSADVNLSEGAHSLRMEYYEHAGDALAQLTWERLESYPDWKAEYYANRRLNGDPVLVRNEVEIDHNWGTVSPGGNVPADNFSARWTRKVNFEDATYLFRVRVDDGVRLWLDDTLIIDDWRDGSPRLIEAERQVSQGKHWIEVEYYEHTGGALIEVSWKRQPRNRPPQAEPGGPYTIAEGGKATFDGGASQDRDGEIVRYEWDFDYDGQTFTADARGERVNTSYPDGPATITIALRVTDDDGATDIATTQVHVMNVAPIVEVGGPYTISEGQLIRLVGTATDPGPADQRNLSYLWFFGDGSQGHGPIVSHRYTQPGKYTLKLTVTDKDGDWGSDTTTVQVLGILKPPMAVIDGPTSGLVGEMLTFDGSRSTDSDGYIVNYTWQFGDGAVTNGITVSHVYSLPGSYLVRLTVTDNDDLSRSEVLPVHIISQPPANQPPTAVISAPVTAAISQPVQFDASGSSDSDGYILSYIWDFGDGILGKGISTTHVYTQSGTFLVTLVVTDDSGLTGGALHILQVGETGSTRPLPAGLSPALPVPQSPGRPGATKGQ
ncbi:MAG: hypothetical protein Kow0063_28190 [Anaerolineae bacterium]